MPSDYVKDLVDHKQRVAKRMQIVANELFKRAANHDNSKFSEEEFEAYDGAFAELQKYAYGTEDFKAALNKIKPAIAHHYAVNDHHPEHFEQGVNQMNLIQLIEMVCDWLAASERSQKDIRAGLEINKKRFGIDEQLCGIIKNTIEKLYAGEKPVEVDPNTLYPDVLLAGPDPD
jgi:hypothetical protein